MELLGFICFAICIFVVLFKPEKEKLAFYAFVAGSAICFVMFFIASWTSVLPYAAY